MGGGYYGGDREEVFAAAPTSTHSDLAEEAFRRQGQERHISPDLNPKDVVLTCEHLSPIVFALDVTGSMGRWTKVIYDKLPMFYGQLLINKYLDDPAISFCAIGDAVTDKAPLQVAPFAQGHELDTLCTKLYLEGDGGGNYHETYELAAWYYLNRCKLRNTQASYMFFLGDELCYPKVLASHIKELIGIDFEDCDTGMVFEKLREKFNLFFLHKPYSDGTPSGQVFCQQVGAEWENLVGRNHVLHLKNDPKMIVDVMLGVIALASGTCGTLQQYIEHMRDRGQTPNRIDSVYEILRPLEHEYQAAPC